MSLISVVIPCYVDENRIGSLHRLRLTLAGFARQSGLPADAYEVIVVDDGSTPELSDTVSAWGHPRTRVVRQEHAGMCSAYNRGIEAATGELIFLGLDDTVPGPDCLAQHMAVHRRNPHTVTVGRESFLLHCALFDDPAAGKIVPDLERQVAGAPGADWFFQAARELDWTDKTVTPEMVVTGFDTLAYVASVPAGYQDMYDALVSGRWRSLILPWLIMRVGNHVVSRHALRDVGGFDEKLDDHHGWYMDLDLGIRLTRHQFDFVHVPQASTVNLYHTKPASIAVGEYTGLAYLFGKFQLPELLYLPLYFRDKLDLATFDDVLGEVRGFLPRPAGANR